MVNIKTCLNRSKVKGKHGKSNCQPIQRKAILPLKHYTKLHLIGIVWKLNVNRAGLNDCITIPIERDNQCHG